MTFKQSLIPLLFRFSIKWGIMEANYLGKTTAQDYSDSEVI